MAAFCQVCGSRMNPIDVDGKVRDVCSNCGNVDYKNWKVSAGVRIDNGGKVLLVRRAIEPGKGKWHMPAGYVEIDETPIQAAEREALEETGYIVEAEKLVDCYLDTEDPRGNVIVLLYDARIIGGNPVTNAEVESIGFFSPEEISFLELAGMSARNEIRDWIEPRSS